jgi:hypothetical protein
MNTNMIYSRLMVIIVSTINITTDEWLGLVGKVSELQGSPQAFLTGCMVAQPPRAPRLLKGESPGKFLYDQESLPLAIIGL